MFNNTRMALTQVARDLKFAYRSCTFGVQIFYIAYLIYAIFAEVGYLWANITLLAICTVYLLFTITTLEMKGRDFKLLKKNAGHTFRWIKISVKAVVLVSMGYSIYISATDPTPTTIILTAIAVIGWILSLSLELLSMYVDNRVQMIINGLKEDWQEIKRPVEAVGNAVGAVGSVVKNLFGR